MICIAGSAHVLREGEALVSTFGEPIEGDTIALCGQEYNIAGTIPPPDFINMDIQDGIAVILPGYSDLERLQNQFGSQEGSAARIPQYRQRAGRILPALWQPHVCGPLLRRAFPDSGVLIIYYKQITEGFDDHARFQIMQNVGMSDKEVRATISKQMLIVFFLPLGMAILHISVAFPVLCKLLTMFSMVDRGLFLACTAGAVLAFALLYLMVYRLTARAYYRIVRFIR